MAPVHNREHDNAWHEMLDSLHSALRHTRYSVSGRMAMSIWRCSRGARDSLSIICPVESKEAVKIWAVSTGGRFSMTDAEPDILTFQAQGGDASSLHSQPRLWRIRMRWLPERVFDSMTKIETRLTCNGKPCTSEYRTTYVNVLTLPALLENSASAWVDHLAKGVSHERLDVVARDILSILDRIMELNFKEVGSGPLSASESRHVLDKAFWIPFMQRYPLALAKFAQCGLGLPSYTRFQPGPNGDMLYSGDTKAGQVKREHQAREHPRQSGEHVHRGRRWHEDREGGGDEKPESKSRRIRPRRPVPEAGPSASRLAHCRTTAERPSRKRTVS
ncbi:hypothetical protein VM1G_06459 [Cytospora mali]|uniref:Uncharacterized protein n=1 Tax=Cytospora mali TaxID=578113 RepID=A0A194W455_CYTMA|nr:hypothetical protein VM1G_06459 [Valsa mali]